MSVTDVERVVHELDAWRRGERPGRLTWRTLEEISGFTRQALSSKPEIGGAYVAVKSAGRVGSRKVRMARPEAQQIDDLCREVKQLKAVLARYDDRWVHWLRNSSVLGFDLDRLDEPLDPPTRAHVRVVRARVRKPN